MFAPFVPVVPDCDRRGAVPSRCVRGGVAVAAALGILVSGGTASAAPLSVSPDGFRVRCTPTDPGLGRLSGLVWSGDVGYAIGDRGDGGDGGDDGLAVLDAATCSVRRWIGVHGIDVHGSGVHGGGVEDLALDGTGIVWAADTGDNDAGRDSVALIGIDPASGEQTTLTLHFSDGPHDVEAFDLTPDGIPVLVTKVNDGPPTVYTTQDGTSVHAVADGATVGLVTAGTVQAAAIDGTTRPITGAAVSADGTIAALRTKKDVYLFTVRDGDVAGAFTAAPVVVIETPEQPQGEAVAFSGSNGLLLASAADGEPIPPILELPDAAALVAQADATTAVARNPGDAVAAVVAAVVVAGGAGWWMLRRRSR